jgi:hypothetical protein
LNGDEREQREPGLRPKAPEGPARRCAFVIRFTFIYFVLQMDFPLGVMGSVQQQLR